ncbi:2'-5' RNA ligase family protein [Belliella sp. DSM 111904]|uniref:2'-5' RNA ligase family protein n=1 Tax=Belliella filtrata TaxID=2923435 RepID=A0ABS9UV36_9BACT|nr:2'-5' RNA ligase family protein [Belliella filtrata]MCH7408032.1 2'-5' RNA ligase family protein [Belliella filtrata]
MAKIIGKYFIAWIPSEEVSAEVNELKTSLQAKFGLKYALKSPPHVTLKMPFSWNEAKEQILIQHLQGFMDQEKGLELGLNGFGKFGKRVIFIKVSRNEALIQLQSRLVHYCKKELEMTKELSDSNYHPHMTIALKDVKAKDFEMYWDYISTLIFYKPKVVGKLVLLKKVDFRWSILAEISS